MVQIYNSEDGTFGTPEPIKLGSLAPVCINRLARPNRSRVVGNIAYRQGLCFARLFPLWELPDLGRLTGRDQANRLKSQKSEYRIAL